MGVLRRIIQEAHRRSLWQVFTVYVALSWAAYQIIDALPGLIGVPPWVTGLALVLFLIGLPVVIATAFVQEGMPTRATTDPTLIRGLDIGRSHVRARYRLFTWKKSLLGGALAFLVLALAAGAYMGMRVAGVGPFASLRAAGLLDERDMIVLADFRNATPDSLLGHVITEALRVDLGNSEAFKIAEPAMIASALARMQRAAVRVLDRELAQEIAQRDNLKAVIAGEVGALGRSYVLTAEIFRAADGVSLATFRETARSADDLIDATDRLARAIRTKVGESLRQVHRSPPLDQVTTRSLAALRKYSEAVQPTLPNPQSLALLEEAIALDSTFAMARRKLGTRLSNTGQRTRAIEEFSAAFELRAHLTDVERALAEADYYRIVQGDTVLAQRAYLRVLDSDPRQASALNNLSLLYIQLHHYEAAEEVASRGAALPYPFATQLAHLFNAQFRLGRDSAMRTTLALFDEHYPNSTWPDERRAWLALLDGNFDTADSIARHLDEPPTPASLRILVRAAAAQGRLSEAERIVEVAHARARARGQPRNAAFRIMLLRMLLAHDIQPRRVGALLDSVAGNVDPTSIALEVPLAELGFSYAQLDNTQQAREFFRRVERRAQEVVGANPHLWVQYGLAARVALFDGNARQALEVLQSATHIANCDACIYHELAIAHEQLAQPDSAIAYYERFLQTRILNDRAFFLLTPVHLRLGELYDARGDRERAARHYSFVIRRWQHADPVLRPELDRIRARLQRFTTER